MKNTNKKRISTFSVLALLLALFSITLMFSSCSSDDSFYEEDDSSFEYSNETYDDSNIENSTEVLSEQCQYVFFNRIR